MDRIAVIGLYLFALGAFAAPAAANVGLALTALAALGRSRAALAILCRHPVWPALLVLVAYLSLHGAGFALTRGLLAGDVEVLQDLAKFALLLPVGLAVAGQLGRARRALLLAGTGLLLCMALNTRWAELAQALTDGVTRLGFGLPMIAFGLYAATALLGLLLLTPPFIEGLPAPRQRRAALVAMTAAAALLGMGLLLCRSRGAWLALALVMPVCAGLLLRRGRLPRPAFATLSVLLVGGLLLGGESVARRLGDDSAAYQALADMAPAGDVGPTLGALPQDSVGLRLRLFGLGFERWRERPLTGHGPNAGDGVIAAAGDPVLQSMAHLHNTYLELLVRFGVLGLAAFAALVGALAVGLRREVRSGAVPAELGLFLAGALALTLIWSAFDFRLLTQDFRFYAVLLGGIALGLGLPQPRRGRAACAS